jgi:hypothetical protein
MLYLAIVMCFIHDICVHALLCDLCINSIFIRILLLFLIFDACVGVLNIYEQITINGAKRRKYGEVIGTRLSHIKGWKMIFFHHKILNIQYQGVIALVHRNPMSQSMLQLKFA